MSLSPSRAYTSSHDLAVYDVSRWERFLYEKRAEIVGGALSNAEREVRNAQIGAALRTRDAETVNEEEVERERAVSTFAGEVFSRLYGNPARREQAEGPGWIGRAHEIVDAIGADFETLREQVSGDPDFAALATSRILAEIAPRLADVVEEEHAREERGEEAGAGGRSGLPGADDRLRSALRRAVATASDEVAEGKAALAGIAPGLEAAPAAHEQADTRRMALAERLRSDARLREIVRRAGRIQRIAARPDTRRRTDGREEVVDVERGGDLARLLPSELARIAHPKLRLLALRGVVERTAMQYRMVGTEPEGRGPIVLLLDESGSMNSRGGDPHAWARAVGIATLAAGAKQKREVTVVGFNGGITSVYRLRKDGTAVRLSTRSPEQVEAEIGGIAEVVLAVASTGASGGTSFDTVLRYALASGVRSTRADLVFVTDDECSVSPEILAEIAAARKSSGLRVYGLTINGGKVAGAAAAICDEVTSLDAPDPATVAARAGGLR